MKLTTLVHINSSLFLGALKDSPADVPDGLVEHMTGLLAGTVPGLPFPKPDPTSGSLPLPMGDASES
jgi:hypothetical protein